MTFMVNTGAEHSVVTSSVVPFNEKTVTIFRATGKQAMQQPFCQALQSELGGHMVRHEFFYLPECIISLRSQDILSKLGAQITFELTGCTSLQLDPRQEEWSLFCAEAQLSHPLEFRTAFPTVWAKDNTPGLAHNQDSVIVELIPGIQLQRQQQYPLPQSGNTLLLPVKKPGGGYRPV